MVSGYRSIWYASLPPAVFLFLLVFPCAFLSIRSNRFRHHFTVPVYAVFFFFWCFTSRRPGSVACFITHSQVSHVQMLWLAVFCSSPRTNIVASRFLFYCLRVHFHASVLLSFFSGVCVVVKNVYSDVFVCSWQINHSFEVWFRF